MATSFTEISRSLEGMSNEQQSGSIPMVKLVYEVDQRRRRKQELGFRPVTISHSRSGFKTMSPAKCNGRSARIPPQTQPRLCDIGSRSSQTRSKNGMKKLFGRL
ncbi:hypothetical protein HanPSC8_Chr01g0010561 [Helianthus annuus]|nr:hypothetical protein HanIR_Chr01g0011951 [Helianthus annuus]KAJ0956088.1 hypothetical protein HanPSC8_Chr01g0010561 [Helianthus annuus]